ncbi:MAG: M20 family metallopeptidase [Planctomycetales bacterium]|nr:M20 family metallopeptidase [Planctomycetales bacterium]
MTRQTIDPVELTMDLVRFDSVSRRSNRDVTDYVQQRLEELGFETERVDYEDDHGTVKCNVIGRAGPTRASIEAQTVGNGSPGMAYFGHTDVVPADDWSGPGGPFEPTLTDDRLYGRGSCDMKGSVACMLAAASRVELGALQAPLFITTTADEEIGYGGARQVAERSRLFGEMCELQTRAVIGEPTRLQVVHAHKGTAGLIATARGESAHSSSRRGRNANLAMIPFLQVMKQMHDELESDPGWQDDRFDPPVVSWNIGINDHTHAINIKPPQSVCTVYFRPMPGQDAEQLLERARQAAEANGLEFQGFNNAAPVFTDPNSAYIVELLGLAGQQRSQTVCYGTDGGVLTDLRQMAVLGPGDIAQAHTAGEFIERSQLDAGVALYQKLIQHWCLS